MLAIAGIVNAFGITLLMIPVKLYDSGIFGTSMLLEQVSPSYLLLSLFLLILNIPLFLIGLKNEERNLPFCYIYCLYIFLIRIALTDVFPINVSIASPLAGTDLFLCALFGGMISGIGNRRYLCDNL